MSNLTTNNTVRRIVASSLVLMAAHLAMPVASADGSLNVAGQSVPSYGIQASDSSLGFGQTVNGMLGDGDETSTNSGELIDFYPISNPAGSTGYLITASSPEFPVVSRLYVLIDEATGEYTPLQEAEVFYLEAPQAQYGGVLPGPGEYAISISSVTPELPNGSYTVNLADPSGGVPQPGAGGAMP